MIKHDEISRRAREIWEREGRPEGRDMEHWLQAEAELHRESEHGAPQRALNSQETAATKDSAITDQHESGRRRSMRRGR
jgi:hypothetical protein